VGARGAKLQREPPARGRALDDVQLARAGGARHRERQQADRAGADDRRRVAGAHAAAAHRAHADGQRLDQRTRLVADGVGQHVHEVGRHGDVARHPAGAVHADVGDPLAAHQLAGAAVPALAAGDAGVVDDAVARAQALHARAQLDDAARQLMTDRDRQLLSGRRVRLARDDGGAGQVLVQVGAADAAPGDLEHDLAGGRVRLRDVVDPQVLATVVAQRLHVTLLLRRR